MCVRARARTCVCEKTQCEISYLFLTIEIARFGQDIYIYNYPFSRKRAISIVKNILNFALRFFSIPYFISNVNT